MSNPYKLRTWRPEREASPFAALLLASRNSGKSHLIRTLWEKVWSKRFALVMVFCGSDHDESYPDFLPGRLFFKTFEPRAIRSLQRLNEARVAQGLPQLPVLIILDDCSEGRERYDDALRSLYTRGRHWNFSVIFATQAVQLSDTVARNNSDIVLIGRQKGHGGRQLAVESFLKGIAEPKDIPAGITEKEFLFTLLKKTTADFGFLVISTSNPSAVEFGDIVYQYRSPIESFKVPRAKKAADAPGRDETGLTAEEAEEALAQRAVDAKGQGLLQGIGEDATDDVSDD